MEFQLIFYGISTNVLLHFSNNVLSHFSNNLSNFIKYFMKLQQTFYIVLTSFACSFMEYLFLEFQQKFYEISKKKNLFHFNKYFIKFQIIINMISNNIS